MSVLRDVKGAVGMMRTVLSVLVWIVSTTWLGARTLWRLGVLAGRLPRAFAQTTRCPRGHRGPLYAPYRCSSCHGISEGYIFGRCRFCGSTPSWTPCPRCGLGVANPLK